jgi:exopolysaccharide biosynthesis polyprenyl glycosylphosphotransferase
LIDCLLACAAFLAAFGLRTMLAESFNISFFESNIGQLKDYSAFLLPLVVSTPVVLSYYNFYSLGISQSRSQILNLCFQCSIILFLIEVLLMFFFKETLSRATFILFVPFCALFLYLRQLALLAIRIQLARSDRRLGNLLLATDYDDKSSWVNDLRQHPELGFRLARKINPGYVELNDFIQILHSESIQLVIFDIKKSSLEKVAEQLQACEEEGIEVWLSTGLFQTRIAQAKVDYFAERPVLIFRSTPDSSLQLLGKTLIDINGALLLLLVFSLPMIAIALAIRLSSKGPAFFSQERSGHYGKPFRMLKFRSMYSDAEQRQDELRRLNEMSGPVFKITKDPRITPIGRWLRKTSLDELPQLINVLRCEMSLVGPRPLPTYETLAISKNEQRRRLSVKPGITCLWQISGRNQVTSFEDWVRLDLDYIDRWSLWLDIEILFKTIPAVLFARGAR